MPGAYVICAPSSGEVNRSLLIDAQVVKLVDTLASGASARKGVEVQVLSWAPFSAYFLSSLEHRDVPQRMQTIGA